MTVDNFKIAEGLIAEIERHEVSIKKLERANSEAFKERNFYMNIYNTEQEEGQIDIPKEAFKTVVVIALSVCRERLSALKSELEKL